MARRRKPSTAKDDSPSMEEILAAIRKIIADDHTFHDDIKKWRKGVSLKLESIVTPSRKTTQGVLVKATAVVWTKIAETLRHDWSRAFEIPSDKWEEIIAGAFDR